MNVPGALREVLSHSECAAHLVFRDAANRRCAVYARKAFPIGPGPFPLIIHAPGGGQTVSDADLAFWTGHGFACVSFDWQHGLYDHDPRHKSSWPANVVTQGNGQHPDQFILPLAVQAIGVVIDWLTQDPRCEASRIGLTGISWGGYLTWLGGVHESRLSAIVPVYGCGGLFESEHACGLSCSPAVQDVWLAEWEPRHLAARQQAPVAYLSGTNDFFGYPVHADAVLDVLSVPHVRSYTPNADHAVDAGASRLAVAWMRQWLMAGPPVPTELSQIGLTAGEPWWTCSTVPDDLACWWPGEPPAFATALVRLHRTPDQLLITTPVVRLQPRETAPPLTSWSELRAGLGWNWGLSTTQLHGNSEVSLTVAAPGRLCITGNRTGELAVILRHTADPRWNTSDFRGMRVALPELCGRTVRVVFVRTAPRGRPTSMRSIVVDAAGWLDITSPPAPWLEIARIDLEGLPGPSIVFGPIERL